MHDASARSSWWGGAYVDLLPAVSECLVSFEGATQPLAAGDVDGRALLVYLESLAPDASAPALPLTVVKTVDGSCATSAQCATPIEICAMTSAGIPYCDLPTGDPTRGADLWTRACASCHGAIHTGAGRVPPATIEPEGVLTHGTDPRTGARAFTIEKVRHGPFFGVGGVMPFYALETLSDPDLADLLTYLGI